MGLCMLPCQKGNFTRHDEALLWNKHVCLAPEHCHVADIYVWWPARGSVDVLYGAGILGLSLLEVTYQFDATGTIQLGKHRRTSNFGTGSRNV